MHSINPIGVYPAARWIQTAPVLFGKHSTRKRIASLSKATGDQCAYCPDTVLRDAKSSHLKFPTFDHLRPKQAKGTGESQNGVVACRECNNKRSNVPMKEFLEGKHAPYFFVDDGRIVLKGELANAFWKQVKAENELRPKRRRDIALNLLATRKHHKSLPQKVSVTAIATRQQAFSDYLKRMVESRVQVTSLREPWFSHAWDSLIYPVWEEGEEPGDPAVLRQLSEKRSKEFLRILATVDPQFWLGQGFEQIVLGDFQQHSPHRRHLLTAINTLRREMGVFALPEGGNPFKKTALSASGATSPVPA